MRGAGPKLRQPSENDRRIALARDFRLLMDAKPRHDTHRSEGDG